MTNRLKINELRVKTFRICGMFLLFLVFINIGYSQTYFSKILPGWGNSVIKETDSSFISFGMNTDWTQLPNYKNHIQISEINKNDTALKSHKIQIDTHTHTQLRIYQNLNVIKRKGTFYLAGDEFKNDNNYSVIINLKNKLDSIQWFKRDTNHLTSRNSVIKNYKNDLLILGDYRSNSGKGITLLKKVDSNGVTIFEKKFEILYENIHLYPKDIVSTSDKGFLILCQEEEPMFKVIGRSIKIFRSTLIKTDSVGNEQWRKHLGDYRFNNFPANIIKAKDDTSFFVSWTNQDSIYHNWYPVFSKWYTIINRDLSGYVLRIGESGKTIWQNNYNFRKSIDSSSSPFSVKNMIKTEDDFIVMAGIGGNGGGLIKIDENGEVIWKRKGIELTDTLVYPKSQTHFLTITETKDKGFVIGGQFINTNGQYVQHAYIMKLDKYGCHKPGCHTQDKWYTDSVQRAEDSIANENNKSNKGESIMLFPNPSHGEVTVKIPADYSFASAVKVSVFDTYGKLVKSFELTDYTTKLAFDKLKSGVYIFRFSYGDVLENKKIVFY